LGLRSDRGRAGPIWVIGSPIKRSVTSCAGTTSLRA
jgi:hypothetical protein